MGVLELFLRCEGNLMNIDYSHKISSISQSLIEYKSDFTIFVTQNPSKGGSIFLSICEIGSVYLLEYLLKFHNDALNKLKCGVNKFGDSGLHLAVWNQNLATVDFLLKQVYFPNNDLTNTSGRFILNSATKYKETPVILACTRKSHHSLAIFRLLLEYKCSMVPVKKNCWFPIFCSSLYNHAKILKYMIDNSIGTNTINTSGDSNYYTPLIAAIMYNNPQAVQVLISFDKTDIDSIKGQFDYSGNDSYTALECAAFFGKSAILRILLRALLKQQHVSDWSSLIQTGIDKRIRQLKVIARKKTTRNEYSGPCVRTAGHRMYNPNEELNAPGFEKTTNDSCTRLLDDLIARGLEKNDYEYIALILRYDIPTLINRGDETLVLPNTTVIIGHNYPCRMTYSYDYDDAVTSGANAEVVGRWTVGELLGCGAFGHVLKGVDIQDKRQVALKYISINKLSKNSKSRKTRITSFIMNELETVELIDHKNVIKLFAYNLNVDNNETMLLVFEYAQYGELYQFLAINKYFNNDIAKTYIEQILDALETCHAMGIIHRDLKPQNILLDAKYQAKVADFGLSTYDNDLTNKNVLRVGTRGYMSPEIASPMINDWDENDRPIYTEITPSCDIFSLGVILWQLLNGIQSMPFDEATESDPKYVYITSKEFDLFWKCHYSCRIVKKSSNKHIQDLILRMFTFIPKKRFGINDIRKHKWYQNVKGYNHSEKSQLFFQDTMKKIHQQLQLKQMIAIKSIAMTKYNSTPITPNKSNNNQINTTTFEFVKLRYVAQFRALVISVELFENYISKSFYCFVGNYSRSFQNIWPQKFPVVYFKLASKTYEIQSYDLAKIVDFDII